MNPYLIAAVAVFGFVAIVLATIAGVFLNTRNEVSS